MRKITQFIFAFLMCIILANPLLAMAQGTTPAPAATSADVPVYQNVQQSVENFLCTPSEGPDDRALEKCINKIYRFGISFGAIALVFFVVFAGYTYIAGGESGKSKAKEIIQNSLVGMALLLGSYVLLRFINPELVVFKPIQPPIFIAEELPTCAALGLGEDCTIHGSETESITRTADGAGRSGTAIECKGGVIPMPSTIPHTSSASRICKDLADKLILLKSRTEIPWIVTSTIRSGNAESGCHGANASKAGNCADVQVLNTRQYAYNKNGGGSVDPRWGEFCEAVNGLGSVNFANEASNTAKCESIRKYKVHTFTSGPHLHINFIGN